MYINNSFAHIFLEGDCPDPGTPTNGTKVGTDYNEGSSVNFTCDIGYTLMGEQEITCNANGTWTSATPTCQGLIFKFYDMVLIYNSMLLS